MIRSWSIVDVLRDHALLRPDQLALVVLPDGETEQLRMGRKMGVVVAYPVQILRAAMRLCESLGLGGCLASGRTSKTANAATSGSSNH